MTTHQFYKIYGWMGPSNLQQLWSCLLPDNAAARPQHYRSRRPGARQRPRGFGYIGRPLAQAAKGFRSGEKSRQLRDFNIGSLSSPSLARNRGKASNSCYCMPVSNNEVVFVGIHTIFLSGAIYFSILLGACQIDR